MTLRTRLRKNWQRVKTEPGLRRDVLVIGSLIVLAMIAGSTILVHQRFSAPWADSYVVYAEFEAVPGVSPSNGQEVRVNGVIKGQITGAEVGEKGKARLELTLEPDTRLYTNATLVLRPKSPLNEMYVSIDPGGPPGEPMESRAVYPVTNTRRPIQIDEVLGHLDDNTRSALGALLREADAALASAQSDLPAGVDAASETLRTLRPVVTQLEQRRTSVRRLVVALGQISDAVGSRDQRIVRLAKSLDETLSATSDNAADLDAALADLPTLTRRLRSSTQAVTGLSKTLKPTLRDLQAATETLPRALDGLSDTAGTLRETVALAGPVAEAAIPVVEDLRPFARSASSAVPDLAVSAGRLDPVTAALVRYLPDLGAFLVQTRSVTSMRDANGGLLRGLLQITPTSFPIQLSGLKPRSTYPTN
jgi:phospholipid/cholesterol/gamma-HCH transport system substrate-binding protein